MTKIFEFTSFKLKNNISESEFLKSASDFHKKFISIQDGIVSHKLVKNGDEWADIAEWRDILSVKSIEKNIASNNYAMNYLSFIDSETVNINHFEIIE